MVEFGTALTAMDMLSRAFSGSTTDSKMDGELRECVKFGLEVALGQCGIDSSELPEAILMEVPAGAVSQLFGNLQQDPEGERAAYDAMAKILAVSSTFDDSQVDTTSILAGFAPAFLRSVRDKASRGGNPLFYKLVVDHLSALQTAEVVDPAEVVIKRRSNLWTLPIAPDPQMRPEVDTILSLIERHSCVTICGGPGSGKSTLAALVAESSITESCNLVWWMHATTRESLVSSCSALLSELGLPPSDDVLVQVRRLLATHERWFLILDDVADDTILSDIVPSRAATGKALITTRDPALTNVGETVPIGEADDETMRSIARALLPQSTSEGEIAGLADACVGSPLAIATTARYISMTGASPQQIEERLRTSPSGVLSHSIGAHYPESFVHVVQDAIKSIEHPHALLTLVATAVLGGRNLPREVLSQLEPRVAGEALDQHVAKLSALGLIGFSPAALACHSLIARLVVTAMKDSTEEVAARIVGACGDLSGGDEWSKLGDLADVAAISADWIPVEQADPSPHLELADSLKNAGMHRSALKHIEIARRATNNDESELSKILVIGANVQLSAGDARGAEITARRAADIAEKAGKYGLVASAFATLAWCHDHMGDRSRALIYAERALQLLPDTSDLIALRDHFAISELSDSEQLKRYRELAEDPSVHEQGRAMYFGMASRVAVRMQHLTEAVNLATQALETDRRTFDDHNIYVARDLNDLGTALIEAGQLDEAESHLRESIKIYESEISDHVLSVQPRTHLSRLLTARAWQSEDKPPPDLALLEEARAIVEPAVARQREVAPNTVEYSSALVALADSIAMSNGKRAIELLEHAVEVDRATFGELHIETSIDVLKLMEQHLFRGDYDDALRVLSLVKPALPKLETSYPQVVSQLLAFQVISIVSSPESGPIEIAEAKSLEPRLRSHQNDARVNQKIRGIIQHAVRQLEDL